MNFPDGLLEFSNLSGVAFTFYAFCSALPLILWLTFMVQTSRGHRPLSGKRPVNPVNPVNPLFLIGMRTENRSQLAKSFEARLGDFNRLS
jgi:hypothetical protein